MQRDKRINQPNFQAIFFDHFGTKPRRQRYELRFDTSNLYHDVIFLSSMIHDARISRNAVHQRKDKVKILMQRDTWENGTLVLENAPKLHYCESQLNISGVQSIEWRFACSIPKEQEELWIVGLDLSRSHESSDYFDLVLDGMDWALWMKLDENRASVMLKDIGLPLSHEVSPEQNE